MKAYQMKITLQVVKPPVWRRVIVPFGLDFAQLRDIMITSMGWLGGHMYAFRFPKKGLYISHSPETGFFADSMFSGFNDDEELDAREIGLEVLLKEGVSFYMDYDFGDGWEHKIVVEKILDDYPFKYPQVVKFKGDCPPEDVGGPWGYVDFLEIIQDPDNPEREEMLEWAESQYFEEYDMESVNGDLFTMAESNYSDVSENSRAFVEYLATTRKPAYDLKALLSSLTVAELKGSAGLMGINRFSSMRKAELIHEMYENWMKNDVFLALLNSDILDDDEIGYMNEIMKSENIYFIEDDVNFPFRLAAMLSSLYIVTPLMGEGRVGLIILSEAKKKYEESLKIIHHLYNQMTDDLDVYARAAVNLYGAIPLSEFAKLYQSLRGVSSGPQISFGGGDDELGTEEIREFLRRLIASYENGEADYAIVGDVLINDTLKEFKEKDIDQLLLLLQMHSRKILPKEEFLKYGDWAYFEETEAHSQLREYLAGKTAGRNPDSATASELVELVCWLTRQWSPVNEVVEFLNEEGITFDTEEEADQVKKMLTEINSHTRIWGDNGSTPAELNQNYSSGVPYRNAGQKIGRNEPCPCGSGKKYKNCCGRNVLMN